MAHTGTPSADASETRAQGRVFAALCVIYFLNSFIVSPFASLFPVYVEADLHRQPWFTGYLRAIMLALGGIFAVVGGRMCDRWGRKPTLLFGLAGSMITGMVFNVTDPAALSFLVIGIGMATGPFTTAGQSYLINSVPTHRLGLCSALYFLSNTFGNSLGSLVTGVLKSHAWPYPRIGTAMTTSLVLAFALALLTLPGDGPARQVGTTGAAPGMWAAYRRVLARREVHLLIGLRFGITSFWGMATLLMPLILYRVSHSQSVPAYFAAVSLAFAAACQLLTGLLCDRYGRFWPLLLSASAVSGCALALSLCWQSLTGLFALGTALTGAAWAVSTLLPRLINDVAGAGEKNLLVGLGHLVWSTAMVVGSLVGGLLVEAHPAAPFGVGAGLAALGALSAWHLCRRLDSNGR